MSALRDDLTAMFYDTALRREPIGSVVDAVLECLRAHRDETLQALGGVRAHYTPNYMGRWYLGDADGPEDDLLDHHVDDRDVWAFGDQTGEAT